MRYSIFMFKRKILLSLKFLLITLICELLLRFYNWFFIVVVHSVSSRYFIMENELRIIFMAKCI